MSILTLEQNQTVQAYLKLAARILDRFELELTADADLNRFKAIYPTIPGHVSVPRSHDPAFSYCHPDNAFWVGFTPKGMAQPIALCAHRMIWTDDLVSEIFTHRIYGDIGPVVDAHDIGMQDGLPHLSGRLGSNGAIVVDKDWRGRRLEGWPDLRLGGLIARVAQALSIRRFRIDYQYSFTQNTDRRRGLAAQGYGMAHSMLATTGFSPINQTDMDLRLNWTSRAELLGRLGEELDQAGRRYGNAAE